MGRYWSRGDRPSRENQQKLRLGERIGERRSVGGYRSGGDRPSMGDQQKLRPGERAGGKRNVIRKFSWKRSSWGNLP